MPIEVYQLRDLFWDNNSYRVPNAIPTQFIRKARFKRKGKIHDYFGGIVRLKGDNWNGAKYKGVYYFLKIVKVLDQDEKICLYALIRDTGSCLLEKGIIVRGDISAGNIDKDLEEHLNKCLPSLETHARIERLALSEDKEKGLDKLATEVAPISADLRQRVVTSRTGEWFLRRIRDEEISKYKSAREYFYRDRNELFLFGIVNGELVTGGKEKIKEKINTWIKQIDDSNTVLVKVGNVSGYQTNRLVGHYALSPKNATGGILGSPDTTQRITKIDLSGCKDLRLIRWDDLSAELDPNKDLLTSGFIDTGQEVAGAEELLGTKLCGKVSRRLMLPIGCQDENNEDEIFPGDKSWIAHKTSGYFPTSFYGRKDYDYPDHLLRDSNYIFKQRCKYWIRNEKQVIKFKEREGHGKKEEGFLYGADKLDFVLSGRINSHPGGGTPRTPNLEKYENIKDVFESAIGDYIGRPAESITPYSPPVDGSGGITQVIPHWPYDDAGKVGIKDRVNPAPNYGLLIFQTVRNYRDGNGWEYIGSTEFKSVFYYSGFNKVFWETYGANDSNRFGFNQNSDTGRSLETFAGKKGKSLARFMLYLDGIAFRLFTADFYEYKYRYDGYNVGKLHEVSDTTAYYVQDQIKANYGKGLARGDNPFKDKDTYIRYTDHKRNPAVEIVTIRDKLDLPFTIAKGDYFFTDLEYYLRNYNSNFGLLDYSGTGGQNKSTVGDYQTLRILGDGLDCKLDSDYSDRPRKADPGIHDDIIRNNFENANKIGNIVLCTDNKGQLEVRVLNTFKKILNLAEGDSNIIESVNDQTFKEVRFFHLSKQNFGVERFTDLDETLKLNLLHLFYNVNGIKTNREANRFLWLTDEEIEGSGLPYLIDLVGTGFYACLKSGEIHLIAKDLQYVEEIEKEAGIQYSLETENVGILQRLQNLSLLEKINQMNVVNYKTLPFPLQGKFRFDGNDNLTIKISGLKADNLQSTQDHFLIECKTEVDEISNISSITKKPVENIAFIPAQIDLDSLRLQQERADEDLALQLSEHRDFAREKIKIARERAEYDLNYEGNTRLADSIGNAISFATSMVSSGYGAAGAAAAAAAAAAASKRTGPLPGAKEAKKAFQVRTGGKVASFAGSLFDSINGFVNRYPEESRRIKEDEAIKLKEVAYASFKFDQTHFRRKQDSKIRLNNISRSFVRENVNDIALSEKFIQKKNLSDTYLTIFLPSEEQLIYLERDREEYGIDCDIPDKQVHIKNGMPANIMRFRNLRDEGFTGIENINEREFLKARLEIGLKIVEIEPAEEHDFIFIEEKRDYENKVRNLQAEVQNLKYKLSGEELARAKEALEQCTKEKADIEETKKSIQEEINKVNKVLEEKTEQVKEIQTKLTTAEQEAAKKQEELKAENEQTKKELEASQRQRTIIEKSYNDAVAAEQSAKQQVNKLTQDLSKVRENNRQKNEQIERLKKRIAKPVEQKRQLQYWDLRYFLEEFRKVDYDYNEMGKIILKAPSYGLNSSELNLYLGTFEYIHQILEMIREFEEDNTSFLISQPDEKARKIILSNIFQTGIKNTRGVITIIFLKALGRRLTDKEGGYIYKFKDLKALFEDRILDQDIKRISQTNKTGIFDSKYPETLEAFDRYSFSNLQTKQLLKDRYGNVTGDFDNSIGKHNVYYDLADVYTGGEAGRILFAAYKRGQESYHENNMHNLHKKVSVDDLFNIYYNDSSNYLKNGLGYQGRKGRQLYLGFIILHIVRVLQSAYEYQQGTKTKSDRHWDAVKHLSFCYAEDIMEMTYAIQTLPEPFADAWDILYRLVFEEPETKRKRQIAKP